MSSLILHDLTNTEKGTTKCTVELEYAFQQYDEEIR